MSQGKGRKEKKNVTGWSIEEMKEKPNIAVVKVVEHDKVEESKREAFRGRGVPLEWRMVRKNKEIQDMKVRREIAGQYFSVFKE